MFGPIEWKAPIQVMIANAYDGNEKHSEIESYHDDGHLPATWVLDLLILPIRG